MRLPLFFLLFSACSPTPQHLLLKSGECILGQDMEVWQLVRQDEKSYLFVEFPGGKESLVHTVSDLSTFKKVDCPD